MESVLKTKVGSGDNLRVWKEKRVMDFSIKEGGFAGETLIPRKEVGTKWGGEGFQEKTVENEKRA